MKKGVTIGGIIAVLLLIGAIAFCAWIAPKINEKLSEINDPIPEETEETETSDGEKTVKLPTAKEPNSIPEAERIYLALGNPSRARANPVYSNNYLLVNKFYAVSYNKNKAIPNWAAWQLTKEDIG